MKRIFKIISYFFLVIFIVITVAFLYLTDFGKSKFLSNEPEKPKLEIPITYDVGWWSYQNDLTIHDFNVEIIESNLNLFNSKSLISYSVKGEIRYAGYWKPYVSEVHISDRVNTDSTSVFKRILEISPIIKVKEDKSKKGGIIKFEFKNEHQLKSIGWGLNRIIFKCQSKEKIIEYNQYK